MSARIVIAGAGGFGRGVYGWIASSPRHREKFGINDVVFIDDAVASVAPQAPVICTIDSYEPGVSDLLVCAVGIPIVRRAIVARLEQRGAVFHTFVDDRAIIGSRVQIADGAVICPGAVIDADVTVGKQVHINKNCSVGHDTRLGAFSTLSPLVNVMGQVEVGESVFFGGSAVVLPRLSIAGSVTVGAGAVIIGDTEPFGVYVGSPGRLIKYASKV